MKYFICTVFLFISAALFADSTPAGELSAGQYYSEKAAALSIAQPVLRTMKLLSLLEKCPSRADELYPVLKEHLKRTQFPPQISASAKQILEKNPGNLTINFLLSQACGDSGTLYERWQKLLLHCPTGNLSELQERVVLISAHVLFQHFAERSMCHKNRDLFIKIFDRFGTKKCNPRFRMLLLEVALDFHRQCIWETDCISPHGKFWEKIPAEGDKMRYLDALNEMENLEKVLEFPFSLNLLKFYNRHRHPRAVRYAGNFLASKDRYIIDALFTTAQSFKNRKLFDHCVNHFSTGKDAAKHAPLLPIIAAVYATDFSDYRLLKKYASPREVEFFRNFNEKKFAAAKAGAEKLLSSGTVTHLSTIRTMVELVWQTKDRALLKNIFAAMEKNPRLLNAENANSAAYTAAVLNIELESAEKLAQLALKQLPDSYAIMDTLAYILYRRKNFAEAHKIIIAAEKLLSPGDACAPLYLHAAEIELAHTRDKAKARRFFNRAQLASRDNDEEFDYTRAAELLEILK